MGHHGSDPFGEDFDRDPKRAEMFKKMKKELLDTSGFKGGTGEYPMGKLTASDEGAIQFQIGVKNGKVVMDFGTPTAWVGMDPQQAADLATILLKRAREAGRLRGVVVTFEIG